MGDNLGEIIIYQTDDGLTNINVKMEDETVWLIQHNLQWMTSNLREMKIHNCVVRHLKIQKSLRKDAVNGVGQGIRHQKFKKIQEKMQ